MNKEPDSRLEATATNCRVWESRCSMISVLLSVFWFVASSEAQPIQPEVLYVFPYGNSPRGPEYPEGNLVQGMDGNFYGVTAGGGEMNRGTVFKVTTDGILSRLVSFNGTNGTSPGGGLVIGNDGNFYGTTSLGGNSGNGTIFKSTPEGILTTLVSFNGTNGANPIAVLTLGPDDNFYGTTSAGGKSYTTFGTGVGTVFKMTSKGELTTLVSFENSDGANPAGGLTLGTDGNFYGTTSSGGERGAGTVFKVTLEGTLTVLASFDRINGDSPRAALTEGVDGNFYGTTAQGGTGLGTIFKITPSGAVTRLYSFNDVTIGATPTAPLILGADGRFYSTSYGGGANGYGTVFRMTTNGTVTRLVSFNKDNGLEPHGGLTLGNDGNFYGMTAAGGGGEVTGNGFGTFFRMTTNGVLTKLASFGKPFFGASPQVGLTQGGDGYFYGTTGLGGSNGMGMVFKLTGKGTMTVLASFNDANGSHPSAALTLGTDGNFYGTTVDGGSSRVGVVFKITTNGTLTRLASFNNVNGAYPQAPLTLGNDGNFYGTTVGGGNASGTVFKVTTNGTLTRLVAFNGTNGGTPLGGLLLASDGSFYGTTTQNLSNNAGTVFKLTTNGTLTTIASFSVSDGHPQGGLTLGPDGNFFGLVGSTFPDMPGTPNFLARLFRVTSQGTVTMLGSHSYLNPGSWLLPTLTLGPDGNFYGTIAGGGSVTPGAVFQVTTNGTFATLISFANTNGAVPLAPLTLGTDGNLYGTTDAGGSDEWLGTIFRINFAEPVVFDQPQPANQVLPSGVSTRLTASVLAAPAWSTQWLFNGDILPGETNTTLTLNSLLPSMSGNYSLRVINSLGSASSSNAVLTVLPALLTNLPVTGMTATGAVLNGSVAIGPNDTLAWIEWGADRNYGQITGVTNIQGATDIVRLSSAIDGLEEGIIYHYRIVAWNNSGIVYGPDQSFELQAIDTYAQSVLADEPLIYYRFEERNTSVAFNSGFRGIVGDGEYNADVSLGNLSLVPLLGNAAGFNNTNSGVAVPALGNYSQMTIEAWVKPRSFVGDLNAGLFDSIYTTDDWVPGALHTHFISQYNGLPFESLHQYQFSINGNTPQWINVGNTGLLPTNRWVHLAVTYDSATREAITYFNGHPFATNSFTIAVPVNLTAGHIGEWSGATATRGNWFDGLIDEFAIYDRALPASRIQAHYQTALGNPVLLTERATNKLVFSWIGPGFRLESNGDVGNATAWKPLIGGSNSPVSITISNSSNQFFRLKLL
jgi:uncharacterized repeat protein (TIGR03803 family)